VPGYFVIVPAIDLFSPLSQIPRQLNRLNPVVKHSVAGKNQSLLIIRSNYSNLIKSFEILNLVRTRQVSLHSSVAWLEQCTVLPLNSAQGTSFKKSLLMRVVNKQCHNEKRTVQQLSL